MHVIHNSEVIIIAIDNGDHESHHENMKKIVTLRL